jgi:DMSO reductase anchor subunit
MRRNLVTMILGIALVAMGVFGIITGGLGSGIIPVAIGGALTYLAFRPGRAALVLFGHVLIVVGCILVTLGIYLLPHSEPTWRHVFTRPLFWGLISIFGGICANFHGFCRCVRSWATGSDTAC